MHRIQKKVSIVEPDKLNEEILETYLNIRNNHADRIEDDFIVTMEGSESSGLCSKKATKLIRGKDPDKIKKAMFTCRLNSICLARLKKDPEAKLNPHLIMLGRKRMKVILVTSLAYCPNLYMAKTPKKRMKKVTKLSTCTYCLDADRNCLCRIQSKKHDHICHTCKTNYLLGHCETCLERKDSRRMKWDQTFSETEIRL